MDAITKVQFYCTGCGKKISES